MSKYDKDSLVKELRLMEVSEDTMSIFNKEFLKNKIIAPPSWDYTPNALDLDVDVDPSTTH